MGGGSRVCYSWLSVHSQSTFKIYFYTHLSRSPEKLQKRIEVDEEEEGAEGVEKKGIKADEKTTGVVFHKESMWESNWNNFRNNNPTVNRELHRC